MIKIINFDDFNNKKCKDLYETLWKDNKFITSTAIYKTKISKTKESNNSYSFIDFSTYDRDKFISILTNIFGIKNRELFSKKFDMAVSGSGKEGHKIMRLHSSSLCSLLFFYNVTDINPLELELCGTTFQFIESQLEVKNRVFDSPSNMDIKLIGWDVRTNEPVELFLESKFAEYYLYSGKTKDISEKYRGENTYSKYFYSDDFLKDNGIRLSKKDDKHFKLIFNKENYPEGFKQMVSHYTGIRNYIDEKTPNKKIYLGEIIFDNTSNKAFYQQVLTEYKTLYSSLAKKMNEHIKIANLETNFEVLEKELSYSLFSKSKHKVEENILRFYNMK